jgi:hypothetical protein
MAVSYPAEILHFSLRAKGMAAWSVIGSLASITNVYVNPIALASIGYWYYLVYIAILVYFITIVYFFFPETKG